MNHTQLLESITKELHNFNKNYIGQNEVSLANEFEDTANAINHLVKVYNYGYEGDELDLLNKHVSQKLTTLYRIIKVRSSYQTDDATAYVLGSLYNYSTIIKTKN